MLTIACVSTAADLVVIQWVHGILLRLVDEVRRGGHSASTLEAQRQHSPGFERSALRYEQLRYEHTEHNPHSLHPDTRRAAGDTANHLSFTDRRI